MDEVTEAVEIPTETVQAETQSKWYDSLEDEGLRGSKTLQRYNTAEDAHKAHMELKSAFGADSVQWPKDADDKVGWDRVHSKMGVPDEASEYKLDAIEPAEGLGEFDKFAFQDMMKKHNIPNGSANALYTDYTSMLNKIATDSQESYSTDLANTQAVLTKKWGEAYGQNIQNGIKVIDQFSNSKEQSEYLTATFAKNPLAIEFLSDIGKQFSEHSTGGFQMAANYNQTPDEMKQELAKIKNSPEYMSENAVTRQAAIDRSLDLRISLSKLTAG